MLIKSKQINLFKYVLLIPMVFGILFHTSCASQNTDSNNESYEYDQVPIFPGCEDFAGKESCLSKNVSKYVYENFNIELAEELGLEGQVRIENFFEIDKEGNVINISSTAPHPDLEKEAIRVIKMLPKMIPGEHDGKKINIAYNMPIVFQVSE